MTAFNAWALQAGQIGNNSFHPVEPFAVRLDHRPPSIPSQWLKPTPQRPLIAIELDGEFCSLAVLLDGADHWRGRTESGRTSRTSRGLARSCDDRAQSACRVPWLSVESQMTSSAGRAWPRLSKPAVVS